MDNQALFKNLKALEDASFPKLCSNCDTEFKNEKDYIENTIPYSESSGFTESKDNNGKSYIKLMRKCQCGTPVLDHFSDRRDVSPKGELRRQAFEKVVQSLIDKGLSREQARKELISHMHNKKSKLLEQMGIFNR
ncbi:hypothetical protein [Aliikangiella sp. IMCC44359]|uniref:hypothetical protein n=1 Tax=Aliikangiella sp. IMCC44359 TaxID=3459125 RepID=UPI00403AEE98